MARLYANENFPLPVVVQLRAMGHDVVTIQDRGQAGEGVPDVEVLRFAKSENRAVLTINRKDFIKLHRLDSDHAGIIVCTLDPDFSRQASNIHEAVTHCSDLRSQLLRVNRPPA